MKIYVHTFGQQKVKSQFEDEATARAIFEQFLPNYLFHSFKIKSIDPETIEIPQINGAGFHFQNKLYTVFAEGHNILFLDGDGIKAMAKKVPEPEAKPESEDEAQN